MHSQHLRTASLICPTETLLDRPVPLPVLGLPLFCRHLRLERCRWIGLALLFEISQSYLSINSYLRHFGGRLGCASINILQRVRNHTTFPSTFLTCHWWNLTLTNHVHKLADLSTSLLVPHADGHAGCNGGTQRRRLAHLGPHDGDIWEQSWRENSAWTISNFTMQMWPKRQFLGCVAWSCIHAAEVEFMQSKARLCEYHVKHSKQHLTIFVRKLETRLRELAPAARGS